MEHGIARSNSYIFACADPKVSEGLAPQPLVTEKIKFGDRELSKIELDIHDVKCGYGRIGNSVGHGGFGCVHDFYLDKADGTRPPTPEMEEWVFKAKLPH